MSLFLKNFAPVIEAFGIEKFPGPVIERAEYRTKDLSFDEMKELCNLLIDNCERAPNIVKITGFAAMVRAKRYKTPLALGMNFEDCHECGDLGVVRVQSEKDGDFLMGCEKTNCKKWEYWRLPRWQDSLKSKFTKTKCPTLWFKPTQNEPYQEKIDAWKNKLRIAAIKLNEMGFQ